MNFQNLGKPHFWSSLFNQSNLSFAFLIFFSQNWNRDSEFVKAISTISLGSTNQFQEPITQIKYVLLIVQQPKNYELMPNLFPEIPANQKQSKQVGFINQVSWKT